MPTFDTTETKQDMHSASRERADDECWCLSGKDGAGEGGRCNEVDTSLAPCPIGRPAPSPSYRRSLSLSLSAACLSQMDKSCSTSWPSASPRFQSTRVVQPPLFLTLCDTLLLSSRQDGKRNKLSFSLFWPGTYRDRLSIYEARY